MSFEELKITVGELKASGAACLHNWGLVEIKDLPDEVVELLPFHEMIEFSGEWPADLTWAAVTLNSKGEGCQLRSQRPTSVMSLVLQSVDGHSCASVHGVARDVDPLGSTRLPCETQRS